MIKLKDIYIEMLMEQNGDITSEDLGKVKKGLKGALAAGALAASSLYPSQISKQEPLEKQPSASFSYSLPEPEPTKKLDTKGLLHAIKFVETSGGKNLKHPWITKGAYAGQRAIGPFAFLPQTFKEFISKSPHYKKKYGEILKIPYGYMDQSGIEDFVAKNPEIHEDLASHYIEQILKRTSAEDAGDVGYVWLYGISGFNRAVAADKDITNSSRYINMQNAYDDFVDKKFSDQ